MERSPLPTVTVFGSLNMDMVTTTSRVPAAGETILADSFSTGCGGKGANQAVAAARLSELRSGKRIARVEMIGAVGRDQFGQRLKSNLAADEVDVSKVNELDGVSTGIANIIVEKQSGQNRIMVTAGANNKPPHPEDVVRFGDYGDVLLCQLECPIDVVTKHITEAANRSIWTLQGQSRHDQTIIILNPSPAAHLSEEIYPLVDYLVLNESEAAALSGIQMKPEDTAEQLAKVSTKFFLMGVARGVIITLGAEGVFYHEREPIDKTSKLPASKVKVVDTTGAGDTFLGAVAVVIALRQKLKSKDNIDLGDAVRFGMEAAELTVQREGAQNSIPSLEEMPAWNQTIEQWDISRENNLD